MGNPSPHEARVPGIIPLSGPFETVPELLFEKKQLIPALQQRSCHVLDDSR
jgi:hypothetical protein